MLDDQELEDAEIKDFKDNAQLKAIIATSKARKMAIRIGEVDINIRASIPKGLRERIVKAAKLWQSGNVDDTTDDEIYEIMAQLCLDDPYNAPALWKYVDQETGDVPVLLKQMMEKITGVEDTAKRFR